MGINIENGHSVFRCVLLTLAYGLPSDRIVNMLRQRGIHVSESYIGEVAGERETIEYLGATIDRIDPEHIDVESLVDRMLVPRKVVEEFLAELGGIK